MDAKLKALKVVDLKSILAAASVSVPAKATKSDLIARIQASKPALAAYASLYSTDDLLTPPEEFVLLFLYIFYCPSNLYPRIDWSTDQPAPKSTASIPTPTPPAPATTIPAPVVSPPVITPTTTVDPELEKRRQRAARFGIPLVEAPVKTSKSKPNPTNPPVVRQSRHHSFFFFFIPLHSSLGCKEARGTRRTLWSQARASRPLCTKRKEALLPPGSGSRPRRVGET